MLKPPPSLTNFFRVTTPSNQVFPPQPSPTINIQIGFLTNALAIPESSQINDFSTLLPEIPKFELRKISKPKTYQTTQTLSGNKLVKELERVIEKEKPKEEIVPDEDISFTLPKVSTTLDGWICGKEQEKKREEEERIKSEIDLQKLKDECDVGEVPKELEFYFGGSNEKCFYACQNLGLNEDNTFLIDFLSSDIGSQIFRENSLSIHIETGNVYFGGYNTNESIYEILLSQQDETKQKSYTTLSYSDTFSNYIRNFLPYLYKLFARQTIAGQMFAN